MLYCFFHITAVIALWVLLTDPLHVGRHGCVGATSEERESSLALGISMWRGGTEGAVRWVEFKGFEGVSSMYMGPK